jgi:hypothetical protein
MKMFSPIALYEEGRRELIANQPRFYQRFPELLPLGLTLCIGTGDGAFWIVLAPWSRLEPNVFLAYDLAADRQAQPHRITFEHLSLDPPPEDDWGDFSVNGDYVASFRPIARADSQEMVDLWNAKSGCAPIKLIT